MKNYIRKYYDLEDNGLGGWIARTEEDTYGVDRIEEPKLFEFYVGDYYSSEKFKHIEFIPGIAGYWDAQMDKGFISGKVLYRGYKSYSIIFSWLFWWMEISLNLRTYKMER